MTLREFYAEEIEATCGIRNAALVRAFADMPRERFLGPGPWLVKGEGDLFGPARATPDADPKRVYHNVAIAIDPARMLFNGAPGVLATWFDALELRPGHAVLHVGCGTGYYSAILAATVGAAGSVEAIDVDQALAARAREALAPWPWIQVRHGDGRAHGSAFNAVVINAGATHVRASWLDALAPGGRLVIPLTVSLPPGSPIGKGLVMLITRTADGYDARVLGMVAIYNAEGMRDPALEQKLGLAVRAGDFVSVRRLRRDPHGEGAGCWLHGPDFCLSRA